MFRRGFWIAGLSLTLFGGLLLAVGGWFMLDRQQVLPLIGHHASGPSGLEVLQADLAAARQRLTVAGTAARETEARLIAEISQRVTLEKENKTLKDDLAYQRRQTMTAEIEASAAAKKLSELEAMLPVSRVVSQKLRDAFSLSGAARHGEQQDAGQSVEQPAASSGRALAPTAGAPTAGHAQAPAMTTQSIKTGDDAAPAVGSSDGSSGSSSVGSSVREALAQGGAAPANETAASAAKATVKKTSRRRTYRRRAAKRRVSKKPQYFLDSLFSGTAF